MIIASPCHGQARNNYNIENIRFAIDQMLGKPGEHANMGPVVEEVILTISKSGSNFSRQGKPCFDLQSRGRRYFPLKDGVGKSRILPAPPAKTIEFLFSVKELH